MIKDRIVLGAISGATSTIAKSVIVGGLKKLGLAEFNGAETVAGMLLPRYSVRTPGGMLVGNITNMMIGTAFGVGITYMLSATGRDKAVFKGTTAAGLIWTFLYGNYANMGGSTVRPALPKTVLSNLVGHMSYGAIASYMITRLGDPALFNGEIPLINTQKSNQVKSFKRVTHRKRRVNNINQRIGEDFQPQSVH